MRKILKAGMKSVDMMLPHDRNYLTKQYNNRSDAIATAIEFLPEDQSIPVYVIDENNGEYIWDSTKEKFEE